MTSYNNFKPYKLEIETPPGSVSGDRFEKIAFGPRRFGDRGRDIMVARYALGSLEVLNPAEANPQEYDNKNRWLDCMTGKELSPLEAATFDESMETYLTKFQLDNQFYILCYLYTKYGIPESVREQSFSNSNPEDDLRFWEGFGDQQMTMTEQEKERYLESEILQLMETQLDVMNTLFQNEFGTLGEATLAVLHGWVPRTQVGNKSYYHDPSIYNSATLYESTEGNIRQVSNAPDLIPKALHQMFFEKDLSQIPQNSDKIQGFRTSAAVVEHPNYRYENTGAEGYGDYLGPDGQYYKISLVKYQQVVRPTEALSIMRIPIDGSRTVEASLAEKAQHHFAAVRYDIVHPEAESLLYSSFLKVSEEFPKSDSTSTMTSEDYSDAISRIGEPDPLTDPDPFVISNTVLGYFYKTDYSLDNLPPLRPSSDAGEEEKSEYRRIIHQLEQTALYDLLVKLEKPVLFKLNPTSADFQNAFTVVGNEYDTIRRVDGTRFENRPTGSPHKERISEIYSNFSVSSNEWLLAPDVFLENLQSLQIPEFSDLPEHFQEIINSIQPYTDIETYLSDDPAAPTPRLYTNTNEPLIKFVEFRFPSLRPGDKYRAKFLVNRTKLDQIVATSGLTESQLLNPIVEGDTPAINTPIRETTIDASSCTDAPLTQAQQQRRFEEFQALAAKRRREIARALREAQSEVARTQAEMESTSIDLGVFGNADVNLFGAINLGGFSGSPRGFGNAVLSAASTLLNDAVEPMSGEFSGNRATRSAATINMTFIEISDRIEKVATSLREAYDSCLEAKVDFNKNYNGNLEATKLEDSLEQLKAYIVRKLPENAEFEFGQDTLAGMVSDIPLVGYLGGKIPQGGADPDGLASNWRWKYPNYIKITFGATTGLITSIQAGEHVILDVRSGSTKKVGSYADLKSLAPALARPMTSIYFSQLYRMSGGSAMGAWSDMFDLGNSELCSDLSVGKKGLAYIKRYTPELDGKVKEFDSIQIWTESNIVSPFNDFWENRTRLSDFTNFENVFGKDEALKLMGNACSPAKVFSEFIHRISPGALLCDFLKCLKIPAFNLSIPDFSYPDWPDFKVFRWWTAAWKFFWDSLGKLVGRFLCTFARTIIDFLRIPWCEDVLRDQLYGEASSGTSVVQNALASGLLDLGLDGDNADMAGDFIERAGLVMTNRELCRLLQGNPLDPAAMAMLVSIARSMGLDQLDDEESIIRLYDHIGTFLPDGYCDTVSGTDWLTTATSCEDTATAVADLRRRLLANDVPEEEINKVLEEAERQLMSQGRALELLSEQGLNAVIPPIMDMANPDAIINDLPKSLMDQTTRSIKSLFESAKVSYVSSLTAYGSAYYLDSFKLPHPSDDDFDEEAAITVETIIENLRIFQEITRESGGELGMTGLLKQIHVLHQIYEVETYGQSKVLSLYKLVSNPDAQESVFPQNALYTDSYEKVNYEARASAGNQPSDMLFPRPIGFSQNGFFNTNEDGEIYNKYYLKEEGSIEYIDYERHIRNSKLSNYNFDHRTTDDEDVDDYGLLVNQIGTPYGFVGQAKLIEMAETKEDLPPGSQLSFLQEIISNRLQEITSLLGSLIGNVVTPTRQEKHLEIIKEVLNASKETTREIRDSDRGFRRDSTIIPQQGIYYSDTQNIEGQPADPESDSFQKLTIDFKEAIGGPGPAVSLYEFKSSGPGPEDSPDQKKYDPYTVTIYGDNLFTGTDENNPKVFRFCDSVVGLENYGAVNSSISRYGSGDAGVTFIEPDGLADATANHFFSVSNYNDIPAGIYTRREIFARMHLRSLRDMVQRYNEGRQDLTQAEKDRMNEESETLSTAGLVRDELYSVHYPEFLEGIFEQIFFSLRNSRIYDENGYFDSFRRRVAGQVLYNEVEDCYKNRFNVSQLGALSFEKMVTDEIGTQIRIEMSKPENSFEYIDYDDIGPVEKALQNVCIIGFVRICLVELLLKGSMAYSVWDFEGVYDEPLMKDFVYEFVKNEMERIPSVADSWRPVVSRITGLDAPFVGLKRLVEQQASKMRDLSKNIYDNDPNIDYYRWFAQYFIPQSEVSKNIILSAGGTDINAAIFIDENGNVVENRAEQLRRLQRPEYFYWEHPLRDLTNILLNPEIDESGSGLSSRRTAQNHLYGNDPFFHIEHGLRVIGPLAALETLVLPTREIISAFTDANIEENPELFTYVEERSPQRLNIQDSLRRTNIAEANIEDYDFKESPEIEGGAAGASIEEYDPEGDLSQREEIFHIDDFLGAINGALSEDDLDKYIKHMQGLYDYDERAGFAPGGTSRNTTVEQADGYPYSIDRTPTRFIKKTRRHIKFRKDFITHGFGDFFNNGFTQGMNLYLFQNWMETHFNSNQFYSTENAEGYLTNFGSNVRQLKADCTNMLDIGQDSTKYYILPEDGKRVLEIYDTLQDRLQDAFNLQGYDNRSFQMSRFLLEDEENGESTFDYLNKQLAHRDNAGPVDPLLKRANLDGFVGIVNDEIDLALRGIGTEFYNPNADNPNKVLRAYGLPHEAPNVKTTSNSKITTGIQRDLFGDSSYDIGNGPGADNILENQDKLTVNPAPPRGGPDTVYTNKIGEFATEQAYNEAKFLFNSAPINNEEHWVETVYEFSGEASILAGLYGSFSIGDTFDPAVIHFLPKQETYDAFLDFHENVLSPLYEGSQDYEIDLGLFKSDILTDYHLSANSRTFFVKNEDSRQNADGEPINAPLGPYIIRPMGIDKLSNVAMTAPWLLRNNNALNGEEYNQNYSYHNTPFDVNQRALMFEYLRDAQQANWQINVADNTQYVAPIDAENPREFTCKILHHRSPEILNPPGQEDLLFFNAPKTKLLPPNVYPIPLRVLVTQVYLAGQTRPSEVYCKVVLPEYLRNMKTSTSIDTTPLERSAAILGNIESLNNSIMDIMNDFRVFHEQITRSFGNPAAEGMEPSFIESLDTRFTTESDGVSSLQREWRGKFPDFTVDFKNKLGNLHQYYRSSAIHPESRVQYCSVERIYSKIFETEVESGQSYNSEQELDSLFVDRGNLLRPLRSNSGVDFYRLPPENSLLNSNFELGYFHQLNSIRAVLNTYLKDKTADSLWGSLTAQTTSPLTSINDNLGQDVLSVFMGESNPCTNIVPTSIEDNTVQSPLNSAIDNIPLGSPDLAYTQIAPLGLTLSSRALGHHRTRRNLIDEEPLSPGNLMIPDAINSSFHAGHMPSWAQALMPTVDLSHIKNADAQAIRTMGYRQLGDHHNDRAGMGRWPSMIFGLENEFCFFNYPFTITRTHNFFSLTQENGSISLFPVSTIPGRTFSPANSIEDRSAFSANIENIEYYFQGDGITLVPQYGFGNHLLDEMDGQWRPNEKFFSNYEAPGNGTIAFRNVAKPNAESQPGILNDGAGDYLVNYNRVPSIKVSSQNINIGKYYCDGRISLADVTIFMRAAIRRALLKTSRVGFEDDGLSGVQRLESLYNHSAFFENANNAAIIKLIIQKNEVAEGEDALGDMSFEAPSSEGGSDAENIFYPEYRDRVRKSNSIIQHDNGTSSRPSSYGCQKKHVFCSHGM